MTQQYTFSNTTDSFKTVFSVKDLIKNYPYLTMNCKIDTSNELTLKIASDSISDSFVKGFSDLVNNLNKMSEDTINKLKVKPRNAWNENEIDEFNNAINVQANINELNESKILTRIINTLDVSRLKSYIHKDVLKEKMVRVKKTLRKNNLENNNNINIKSVLLVINKINVPRYKRLFRVLLGVVMEMLEQINVKEFYTYIQLLTYSIKISVITGKKLSILNDIEKRVGNI